MKQVLFLALAFLFYTNRLSAQGKECEVKMDAIKGLYTGECAEGKATGKGKSVGTDQYEGDFKDGYPDGKGMYTWKDGHYFVGAFKKGRKEGKGDMYYESASGGDSVITGFWKKDKYFGLYEKQYEVISTSSRVTKVDCSLTDKIGEDIFITVHQLRSGGAVISNITNITGTYYTKSNQVMTNSSMTKIQQVTFPFRAIFNLSNGESAEIIFNEKGNYDVYMDVQ